MRLICPNCDAEYEVDAAAIPPAGREVQCSACGHGWFQGPAALELAQAEAPAMASSRLAQLSPHPAAEPPRRSIDESVLAVLREEAEREAAARRGERPALETQTELALAEAPKPRLPFDAADEPPFETRPQRPEPEPAPVVRSEPSKKRALLPEIDEVKSALNPVFAPRQTLPPPPPPADGFRSGFIFALLVAVIFLALYILSPLIIAKIPASQAVMSAYVDFVDSSRRQLDEGLRGLIDWLRAQAQGSGS